MWWREALSDIAFKSPYPLQEKSIIRRQTTSSGSRNSYSSHFALLAASLIVLQGSRPNIVLTQPFVLLHPIRTDAASTLAVICYTV